MRDVAELLQQLEDAEVAPPTTEVETQIWHAIVERLEDRPWWHRFLPGPGFGRTIVTGVAIAAGVVAALAVVSLVMGLVADEPRTPPVIGERGPGELQPVPEALRGGDLPPFRATVEVRPELSEEYVYVWEVSYDGAGRVRRELIESRGATPVPLDGAFVVSDGRQIGIHHPLNRSADGAAVFVLESLRDSLIAPWSWTETWASSCDAPEDGPEATCHDWRGIAYDVAHDPDTGLVTLVRGPLTELGYVGPTEGLVQVGAVESEDGTFVAQVPPTGELRVVEVDWAPAFGDATFVVAGPEDADVVDTRGAFVADEELYQGPTRPLPSFSMTVSTYGDEAPPEGEDLPRRATWRWDLRDRDAWRVEAVANGDPAWDAWVGSYEVYDGQVHAVYDAASRLFEVSDLPWPGRSEVLLPIASYLPPALVGVHPQDLDGWLRDACESDGAAEQGGRIGTRYRCPEANARLELLVDDETGIVLRRELHIPGAPVGREPTQFALDALVLDPDLAGLDLSTSPPAGSFDPGNGATTGRGTTLVVDEPAPLMTGRAADGREFSTADVGEGATVVLFQGGDCPPTHPACRAFDALVAIAAERADVRTVWVTSDHDGPPIAQRRGFRGTVVIDDGRETRAAWGVGGGVFDPQHPRPLWVVLDVDGIVRLASTARLTHADIEAAVDAAAA